MMRKALVCTMLLGVACSPPAAADDPGRGNGHRGGGSSELKFNGGIGVHPVSSVINCPAAPTPCVTNAVVTPPTLPVTVNLNIVRGVSPAGQIWVIDDLDAKVGTDGSIKVKGKGLILAGGNNAGRPPPGTSVFATLICQPAVTPPTPQPDFTQFSSSSIGVLLSPTGDFQINDKLLNGTNPPPIPCTSPMLLIRNAANLSWFAVGIYRPSGSDH
jgi:hypothetical protein